MKCGIHPYKWIKSVPFIRSKRWPKCQIQEWTDQRLGCYNETTKIVQNNFTFTLDKWYFDQQQIPGEMNVQLRILRIAIFTVLYSKHQFVLILYVIYSDYQYMAWTITNDDAKNKLYNFNLLHNQLVFFFSQTKRWI